MEISIRGWVLTLARLAVVSLALVAVGQADEVGGRPTRLTPEELPWPASDGKAQPGSSMQGAVQSLVIFGNASKSGLYSILFKVGPDAQIPAHSHPDDRSCFVMVGVWYFGYGDKFSTTALKALPPGSHYTEPAGVNHFAGTRSEGATVECTSVGPSETKFVDPKDDPRPKPPIAAAVASFPATFKTQMVQTNGTTLYVRVGGKGPAVILLHGFGDTGDMWAPLAADLAKDHTVIVPDLRGMGLSAHPDTGYTKKNQAVDIAGVLDSQKIEKADLVTHDIGNMVGYALAAQYRNRIKRWVVIDAPLPGVGNWDKFLLSPMLWHFNFRGRDEERLVQGRERIYLDRFWNELSADPSKISEETRSHYAALYAQPHAMHDAFEQFGAFSQDAVDNRALLAQGGKLTLPVLALGGEKSFGTGQATELSFAASAVTAGVIPASGHWIMEENPQFTIKAVTEFLRQ